MTQQNLLDSNLRESGDEVKAPVNLFGRFMVPSGKEFQCKITEMSTREASLSSAEKPEVGQKIVIYAHDLGRFVGVVERHQESSFAARLDLATSKRARIAERLAWHVASRQSGAVERRAHPRIVPMRQVTVIRLPSGTEYFGRINNVSAEGVEIAANLNIELGANITVDSRPATIKRPLDGGFYAEFTEREALACTKFGVAFGAKVVLADVTLSLHSHGVTVLMGPVGAGKSTLLRSLAALFSKNELYTSWGQALYLGAPVSTSNAPALVKQRIEMTQRSVLDSLLYHVTDANLEPEAQRARVISWLEQLGANDAIPHLDDAFVDLDTGLQRKVAILREASAQPALLMIDEPTNGLCEEDAADVLRLIEVLARHAAVLLVLHNQQQARAIAQSVMLLAGGRIQEHSSAERFFASENPVTRRFIETGSCALPAPDAKPETLAEDAPPPPPLPEEAVRALEQFGDKEPNSLEPPVGVTKPVEAPTPPSKPQAHWLEELKPKPLADASGPEGFCWIVEGRLAGAPRPGAIHDLGYDLDLVKQVGVTTLVTLTETNLPQSALFLRGLENVHLPIPDGKAPTIESALLLLRRMRKLMEAGRVLLVHCLQGAGRTGTILAACLIEGRGLSAQAAISQLRQVNPEFVKTKDQEAFLTAFEQIVGARN